jgi:short-subunit dehydrogenase
MTHSKPLALVTGASSGIGATFARRLSRDGYGLILVARRRDRLEDLARELGGAEILSADLTRDADLGAVEQRIAAASELEMVVNNAGFGTLGTFWESDLAAQERMHRLHVMATVRLSHATLRAMVPRGKGALINVSSVAGFGTAPGSVSYSATKAWMNTFTEGLDLELKMQGSAVKVQALCPGFTITEFHDAARVDRGTIPGWLWMKAEDVVDASLEGLAKGEVLVVPGAIYQALVKLESWLPHGARAAMAMRYAKKARRHEAANIGSASL